MIVHFNGQSLKYYALLTPNFTILKKKTELIKCGKTGCSLQRK